MSCAVVRLRFLATACPVVLTSDFQLAGGKHARTKSNQELSHNSVKKKKVEARGKYLVVFATRLKLIVDAF